MKWAVVLTKEKRRAVGGLWGDEVGVVAQVEVWCFKDVCFKLSVMFKCMPEDNVWLHFYSQLLISVADERVL